MDKKEVVVVTGASGFAAQHLIKELQLGAVEWIKEIRLVDKQPFSKFLEYPERIPTKFFLNDCADASALELILAGCGTVFHLAAKRYQLTLFADDDDYWHDNLTATEILVDQMIASSVPRIIFVGDALSNIPAGDHFALSEGVMQDAPSNGNYLLGAYGESKFRAELYVRNATGQKLHNGGVLTSLMLRPTILYGEGESSIVPNALKFTEIFGCLPHVGCGESGKYQMMYAGNLAALLVKSWRNLADKPNEFSGEMCYCNDNTPCVQIFDYLRPFIELGGSKVGSMKINYYVASMTALCTEMFCTIVNRWSGLKYGQQLPSYQTTRLAAAWCFGFPTRKMRLFLDFFPPYKPDCAMENTIAWWKAKLVEDTMTNSQRSINTMRRG